jgi:outer membrane lipoprotein-sorting protein
MTPPVPVRAGGSHEFQIPVMLSRFAVLLPLFAWVLLPAAPAVAEERGEPMAQQAAALEGAALPHPRDEGLGPSERVGVLLDRVRVEQNKLESLEAEFIQIKESALLLEPVESRGGFAFSAPDKVRWEYQSPNPISILIVDEDMTTWYHDIQQAERVSVGRQSQRFLQYLGAGSSMDDLLTLTVPTDESEPYVFDLAPRFDKVEKRIKGMTVWIDPDLFLPLRLRYVEADGDITDLRFENLRVNEGVPSEHFELELPATVEVRQVELDRSAGRR